MLKSSYTQGYDENVLKSHQSRTAEANADYLLPHVKANHQILDIGCGPGTITASFVKYVPEGRVVGVDISDKVLEQARKEAASQKIDGNLEFHTGSAHVLPFEDESFDIVHCHALLVHLPNALAAVKEMRRVCKQGGYVAAREPDWETMVVHPFSEPVQRWKLIQAQLKRQEGAEPNAGRHLAQWAFQAGFSSENVRITSDVLQYYGEADRKFWNNSFGSRIQTEVGQRAISAGLTSSQELALVVEAYQDWSHCEYGLWTLTHMQLLARK